MISKQLIHSGFIICTMQVLPVVTCFGSLQVCVSLGEQDRQPTAAGPSGSGHESTAMEEQLLNNLAPSEVMAKAAKPRLPIEQLQFLQMLAGKDPAILAQFGASAQVRDNKTQQPIS